MRFGIIIIIRRFLELFILNFIISSFITILHLTGILSTRNSLSPALIIGAVIFFALNVSALRYCYYDMRRNRREYYIFNTIAYLLFALVGFIIYIFGSSELYTWIFAITKLIKYTVNGVATHYSALFFHCIGLATVFLAPLGMKWAHSVDSK